MKLNKLLLAWCILYCAFFADVWSEPQLIDTTGRITPRLNVDNLGGCWCTVGEDLYRFNSETSSWELKTTIPPPYGLPCFGRGDTLWLFDNTAFTIFYHYYYNGNWSDIDTILNRYWGFDYLNATIDSSGAAWLFWRPDWWFRWPVMYTHNRDGEWKTPIYLTDTLEDDVEDIIQCATTDAHGRVWVSWYEYTPPHIPKIDNPERVVYWDRNGWSEEMAIVSGPNTEPHGHCLCPDHQGGVWAIAHRFTNDRYWIMSTHWDEVEWSPPDTVAKSDSLSNIISLPRIAVNESGNAWVAWRHRLGCEDEYIYCVYYSVNTGGGWSEPEPVDTTSIYTWYPRTAVDGEGRVWCAWWENRNGTEGIWASYTTASGVDEEPPVTPVTHQPTLTVEKKIGSSFTFRVSNLNSPAQISIYDASGRNVRNLGVNSDVVAWDGRDVDGKPLPAGVYFVRFATKEYQTSKKMVLVK